MDTKAVLLIEDNLDDETLTRRAFAKAKLKNQLTVARTGAEALECLFGTGAWAGRPVVPALILLDLNLPRIDGLEVLRRMRQDPRTRFYPVVVLTSSKEEQDLTQSYDLGINSYIRKPVDFQKFVEAMQALQRYWLVWNELPPRRAA
jgi:two-component system response regulator